MEKFDDVNNHEECKASDEFENQRRKPMSRIAKFGRRWSLQIGILAVLFVVWGLFLYGAPSTFLAPEIYRAFMQTTPFFAIVALPLTLVVIAKEIDLSFSSVMAWGMTIFFIVYNLTQSYWLALIGCLLAGLFAGYINGLIIVKIGVPSLVATIGTQYLWRGIVLVVTDGKGASLVSAKTEFFSSCFVGRIYGIPMQMIWTIVIAIAVWVLLNRTRIGAHFYLIGDNLESSRLMGIPVDKRRILVFCLVGVAAAFSGMLSSLEISYFWPTIGDGYLLPPLASVFLGGTSVFGGTGTIFGTFIASFVIGAINGGIVAVGLAGFWTQLIYGLIIVASISIQTMLSRRLR